MCSRIAIKIPRDEMNTIFHNLESTQISTNFPPRDMVSPTDQALFVTGDTDGFHLNEGMWWLVPSWANEKSKYPTFNARIETLHEKPSFRDAYKSRRCLVPVSGYYEWSSLDGVKQPYLVTLPNDEPMVLSGLWEYNAKLDIRSFTIITKAASENMEPLHSRMPIPLREEVFSRWLASDTSYNEVQALFDLNRSTEMVYSTTQYGGETKPQMTLF